MFYSSDLLSAHRGKFGIIWLAATRVRKHLSRRELNSVNIVAACTEITSYVLGKTKLRLSLYLASQLTFGICIIYREKVICMLRDLQELNQRAAITVSVHSVDLPDSKKSRSKSKRIVSMDAPELPLKSNFGDFMGFGDLQLPDILSSSFNEPCLDFIESQSLYQARNEDITLIEDNPMPVPNSFAFHDDLIPPICDLDEASRSAINLSPNFSQKKRFKHLILDESFEKTEEPPAKRRSIVPSESETKRKDDFEYPPIISSNLLEQNDRYIEGPLESVDKKKDEQSDLLTVQPQSLEKLINECIQEPLEPIQENMLITLDQVSDFQSILTMKPHDEKIILMGNENQSNKIIEDFELPSDLLGSTRETLIQRQSDSDTQLAKPCCVMIEPIPPQTIRHHLHYHPSPLRSPGVRRDRVVPVKRGHNKLIVDEVTSLTHTQLRWNMAHSEETMVQRSSILAEPMSHTRTQYLLSRNVNRLLAVPANLETALSAKLGEVRGKVGLWCNYRRICEQAVHRDNEESALSIFQTPQSNRHIRSSSKMKTLSEDTETSIEVQRAAQATPSLQRTTSLLGGSGLNDLSLNHPSTSTRDSLVLTKFPVEEPIDSTKDNQLVIPVPVTEPGPIQTPVVSTTNPTESTTLVPVPEELEEQIIHPVVDPSVRDNVQPQLLDEVTDQPQGNLKHRFPDRKSVWMYIQTLFNARNSTNRSLEITDICPIGSSKKDAALVFATLLDLVKKHRVRLSQSTQFGTIQIDLIS